MKYFDRIFLAVLAVILFLFLAVNVLLDWQGTEGKPYRVEISRMARMISESGFEAVDWSECEYVTQIERYHGSGAAFFETSEEYLIREIDGTLYRFDYRISPKQAGNTKVLVNVFLAFLSLLTVGVFLYLRQKLLRPFERLVEVPYELSRGNLTVPLKEERSRFFGRFIWGVNMLRESIEEQKQRELRLQRDRKRLVLSLSHDIRTPLSAIKLYARALSKGLYEEEEKQVEAAEQICAKADEIEGYVSKIAMASKEDFLNLEVSKGEFYLSALVKELERYYKEKMELVKTEFMVGSYTDCILKGEIDRGIEVLQNVIENAMKYGDGKRIALDFSEEEDCRILTVKNSGCTLPQTELANIFESFWRGSNAGSNEGSGLGLYICRQLMHKMDGEILAEIQGDDMCVTVVFRKAE